MRIGLVSKKNVVRKLQIQENKVVGVSVAKGNGGKKALKNETGELVV